MTDADDEQDEFTLTPALLLCAAAVLFFLLGMLNDMVDLGQSFVLFRPMALALSVAGPMIVLFLLAWQVFRRLWRRMVSLIVGLVLATGLYVLAKNAVDPQWLRLQFERNQSEQRPLERQRGESKFVDRSDTHPCSLLLRLLS